MVTKTDTQAVVALCYDGAVQTLTSRDAGIRFCNEHPELEYTVQELREVPDDFD
jgi:hypothetical protein